MIFRSRTSGVGGPRRGYVARIERYNIPVRPVRSDANYDPRFTQRYEVGQRLGVGGMSFSINSVRCKQTGQVFVAKQLRPANRELQERMHAEVETLARIRHDTPRNVNRLHDSFEPQDAPCVLVLEFCDRGTLHNFLYERHQRGTIIGVSFAHHLLLGIANALTYLAHGVVDYAGTSGAAFPSRWNPIFHLDLKPDNIFLSSQGRRSEHPRIVVGDFGCTSSQEDVDSGARVFAGLPAYTAPEASHLLQFPYFGTETDIWAMGAVMHVASTGIPFPMCHPDQMHTLPYPCGRRTSSFLNDTARVCLSRDPTARPAAVQVVRWVLRRASERGMEIG